ncbi:MAG: trypsin-like peptidase domain-containing protein [Spirochaetes bacterium]|nr:trypsin-like peptidase domain-containing protein [Spirochaetota bacterium]
MNLVRKLSARSFFTFNLVMLGVIFGLLMAFVFFSCSVPRAKSSRDALASAESLQRALNTVADKVLPSVVEIKTASAVQMRNIPGFDGIPWDLFFGPRGDRERGFSIGSGVIVRRDGNVFYVLTNNHVIGNAAEIIVGTRDGREYPGRVIGRDSRRDLAIVSFESSGNFPLAELGNSDKVRVGDWAIAMGNPLGAQFSFSVTMGIVSAIGRTGGPAGNINDFIQTDASINQGNSGGPLVNIRGEVIGINTWIASPTGGGNVGLGFAIPINNAKRAIDEFITHGALREGWLGVILTDPDRVTAAALGVTGRMGSKLAYLSLGSPAHRGGIRVGDFFTHVDNAEVRNTTHFIQMVSDLIPGQKAVFRVLRGGASKNFSVIIADRRAQVSQDSRNLWPGVSVHPLTDELRTVFSLGKDVRGVLVAQVIPGTPGAIVGLRSGDLIVAINDIQVDDLLSFFRVLGEEQEEGLWFTFIRGNRTMDSSVFRRQRQPE